MPKAEHIVPGFDDPTCGIAVAAKKLIARGVGEEDEVWVHSMWTPMVIWASIKALLTGKKLVRMPHGCTDPTKLRFHWNKKRWVAPIERWIFRHADHIVATCQDEAIWIKSFERSVRKIELLPLFPDLERKADVSPQNEKELISGHALLNGRSFRLLYVGRLHKLKGVEYLMFALSEIPSHDSIELRLIGKDEGEGRHLRDLAIKFGLNVKFEGVTSEEDKNVAYDWCDILVLPTLSENFGLVVAEALERGKRVITTDGAPAWGDGNDYGGRLVYLKGYRDGTQEKRVELLRDALKALAQNVNHETH